MLRLTEITLSKNSNLIRVSLQFYHKIPSNWLKENAALDSMHAIPIQTCKRGWGG